MSFYISFSLLVDVIKELLTSQSTVTHGDLPEIASEVLNPTQYYTPVILLAVLFTVLKSQHLWLRNQEIWNRLETELKGQKPYLFNKIYLSEDALGGSLEDNLDEIDSSESLGTFSVWVDSAILLVKNSDLFQFFFNVPKKKESDISGLIKIVYSQRLQLGAVK